MSDCSKFGPIECKAYLTKNQNESRLRSKMKKCFLFLKLSRKESQLNSGILKVKYHSFKNEIKKIEFESLKCSFYEPAKRLTIFLVLLSNSVAKRSNSAGVYVFVDLSENFENLSQTELEIIGISKSDVKIDESAPDCQIIARQANKKPEIIANQSLKSKNCLLVKDVHIYEYIEANFPECQLAQLSNLNLLSFYMLNTPKLRVLNVSNNRLQKIPFSIFSLKNLEDLDLSFNFITFLPQVITKLLKLQTLDIKSNQIGQLPKTLFSMRHLQKCDVSGNEFSTLMPNVVLKKKLLPLKFLCYEIMNDSGLLDDQKHSPITHKSLTQCELCYRFFPISNCARMTYNRKLQFNFTITSNSNIEVYIIACLRCYQND